MRRFTPVLVAALVVATVAGWGWARAATDCSSSLCVYLPFIQADIQPTEAPTPVRIATPTKTPQGVFIVGQTFSYVDSINYLHIIGEVRNTRSGPVQFVKMTVNIFDSQQRLVATDFTYTYLDVLSPDTTTCFEEVLKAPSDVGSIQFEKVSYSTANTVLPNLTVLNDSGSYDPTFHYYNIIGLVRNDDTVLVKFVNVVATLYNAASVPISCDFTYVSSTDLDVGQTSSFRLITSGRDFSDVVSYKLQADGNRQ